MQCFLTTILLITLLGCGGRENNSKSDQDKFYTVTGGWDWVRVRLIKPYEVKKVDSEIKTNLWGVEFVNSPSANKVKRVDVNDSIIHLLCGKIAEKEDSILVDLRNVPRGWFMIDVKQKTKKVIWSE